MTVVVLRPAGKSLTCWPSAGDYQDLKLIVFEIKFESLVIDKGLAYIMPVLTNSCI